MQIVVRFFGVPNSLAVGDYARRRLELALDQFAPLIRSVDVRLADINGPRGGVDKRCIVAVRLRSSGRPIIVRAFGASLEECLSRAAGRAQLRVDRAATPHSRARRVA